MKPSVSYTDKGGAAQVHWSARHLLLLFLAFLFLTVGLYWRTLITNFVYDDWVVLDELHGSGILAAILHHCDPRGVAVFRPLGWVYFGLLYGTFGLTPLPFHIASFLLHSLNGTLVAVICTDHDARRLTGILSGAAFIALASLHLEAFQWLVGFYDIGAMTFALLSIVLAERRHVWASAAMMACALMTKEASAFLPLLLGLWIWVRKRPLRDLAPTAIIAVAYGIAKLLGLSPFSLPHDSGHAMAASWQVFFNRLVEYSTWLMEAVLPLGHNTPAILLASIIAVIVVGWFLMRRQLTEKAAASWIVLLILWILLALLPVLFLKNQSAKYYAVHATVPTVLLMATMLAELTAPFSVNGKAAIFACVIAGLSLGNVERVNAMFSLGIRQFIINDGYFHLVKRTAAVQAVHDSLTLRHPRLLHGSTVRIEGIPLDALGGNRAIRLWYGDSTLQVLEGLPSEREDSTCEARNSDSLLVIIDLRNCAVTH
jgi:hypothetical protein